MAPRFLTVPVFAAALAAASLCSAQEGDLAREAAAAAACVPPPCNTILDFPPCDDPVTQHEMRGVLVMGVNVADGPEVRPLGGAITGPPELAVCVQREDETFQFYLPGVSDPVLRLGMLSLLNTAMQARLPLDIAYGMPNGALRKIEEITFGAAVEGAPALQKCGYGDFDRCDTRYEKTPAAASKAVARIVRTHVFGYGKGSHAAQILTDDKANPAYLIDPAASSEGFLQLLNGAFTAQVTGQAIEIESAPGAAPKEAANQGPVPPLATAIRPANR